jgi:hypothetical protein
MKSVIDVGADVFIDLDDYFAITEEGQAGWVTVWLVGNLGVSIGFPPVHLGVVRLPGQPYDPDFYFETNIGISATVLTELVNIELVPGQTTINYLEFNSASTEINLTFIENVFPIAKIEVRKEYLDTCLINAIAPGNPIGAQLFAQMFINQLLSLMSGQLPTDIVRFATPYDLDFSNPGPPDLVVKDIYFYCIDDCDSVIVQGTQVNVQALVQNIGQSNVSFNLSFYLDQISQENLISRFSALSLYGDYDPNDGWISFLSKTIVWNTTTVTPGNHKIIVRVEQSSPDEYDYENNIGYVGMVIIPSAPVASIVSISPNPAIQGTDTIIFTASANDTDTLGSPPPIRTYRWTSNLGKTNGGTELYKGANASFSLPASDLKAGTHAISLTAQDNEGDWSEPVTSSLTIVQNAPAQGHDVSVELYVNEAGVTQLPGSTITGDVWATNSGNYIESGNLDVSLEKPDGVPLDSRNFSFSSLCKGCSTNHYSFSLVSNYQGVACVHARANVPLDEDLSNNEKKIPVYFSTNLNPTDSFDGFESIKISSGETKYVYDRQGLEHTIEFIGINDPQGYHITITIDGMWFEPYVGEYLLGLPSWAVIHLASRDVGTWKYNFYFWWPDNLYKFSTQYLTIPFGGSVQFEISRTSGSWPDGIFDVEFMSGLLPGGWTSSATPNGNKMVVEIRAPYSCGTARYDGWVHMHRKGSVGGYYGDAFSFMRLQAVYSPPETVINSGTDGTISVRDVTFAWSGSDDTTETSQLQYAYRLSPLESEFSSFLSDTSKTYFELEDGQYTFYVKARDLGECEDPTPASRSFTVSANHSPNLPVNIFPISGQRKVYLTPTFMASQFSDSDQADTFAQSRFQVRSDAGTYDNSVWDSGEISPGTTTIQVTQRLAFQSKYWWRCQYQDNKGAWSVWSNETSFSTKGFYNFNDFAIFANYWLKLCSAPNWCEGSDLNRSGMVDAEDLAIFEESWLESFRPVVIPDFTGDRVVNFQDYSILANSWLKNNPLLDIAPAGGDGIIDFRDLSALCWYWLEGTTP